MATFVAKNKQQAAPATGRRARIHTEIKEQPSFFLKLKLTILKLENNQKIH